MLKNKFADIKPKHIYFVDYYIRIKSKKNIPTVQRNDNFQLCPQESQGWEEGKPPPDAPQLT